MATAPYKMLYSERITPPCSATAVIARKTRWLAQFSSRMCLFPSGFSNFTSSLPFLTSIATNLILNLAIQKRKRRRKKLTWKETPQHTRHCKSNKQPLCCYKLNSLAKPDHQLIFAPRTFIRCHRLCCRHNHCSPVTSLANITKKKCSYRDRS